MNKLEQLFAVQIATAIKDSCYSAHAPAFAESLAKALGAIVARELKGADTQLNAAAGYNASVYREAIAMAIQWASAQVERRESTQTQPPAVRDMTKPAEMLKQAAFDYEGITIAKDDAAAAKLEHMLKRAALVFAADELEQLHERRPELPVLVAIRNLYRLALGLS